MECFSQILAHLKYLIACQGKEQFTHISIGENCKWHDGGANTKRQPGEKGEQRRRD